jgi:hypothetical protein
MRAFQKFDPAADRSMRVSPLPAAKPAKVAKAGRHFSSFSNFSRATAAARDSWTAADWQAYFDERAAIREYDGGFTRTEAERLAFDDAVGHWLSAHPAPASAPEHCAQCCGGPRTYDELLPVLASGGHVWVHNKCWSVWYAARRLEAVAHAAGHRPWPSPSREFRKVSERQFSTMRR